MICNETLRKYCSEDLALIEGYAEAIADNERTWIAHHWLEFGASKDELKEMGLYYNRPAKELILVPNDYEHFKLPHVGRVDCGKYERNEELRAEISKSKLGNTYRRGKRFSDESKAKISESRKGKGSWSKETSEERCNNISKGLIGRKFSDETRAKMRAAKLGKTAPCKGRHKVIMPDGKVRMVKEY